MLIKLEFKNSIYGYIIVVRQSSFETLKSKKLAWKALFIIQCSFKLTGTLSVRKYKKKNYISCTKLGYVIIPSLRCNNFEINTKQNKPF